MSSLTRIMLEMGTGKALHSGDYTRAALRAIDYDKLLIIGSGFSFHNLRAFFSPVTDASMQMNLVFEQWLIETMSSPAVDENQRAGRLINWAQAPGARYCHPREEHLLPLHVCYGVAGSACNEYIELNIMGKKSSLYLW